jgi:hypothetical protein
MAHPNGRRFAYCLPFCGEGSEYLTPDLIGARLRTRVPDAVQRSSRYAAEPGPTLQIWPRLCSAPRRKGGALRCVRGTKELNLAPMTPDLSSRRAAEGEARR